VKVENEGLRRILSRYADQAEARKVKEAQERREKVEEADEVIVSDRARELQRARPRDSMRWPRRERRRSRPYARTSRQAPTG